MARGFCFRCNRKVGGIFSAPAWYCPACRKVYCERCPKKTVGRFFKKFVCPDCRVEMSGG